MAAHQIFEVLVEQLDQRAPVERLLHRQVIRVEEHAVQTGLAQLLADAPHHVDVGIVVELDRGPEVEVVAALLRGQAGQIATHLGLAGSGQGEQQQDVQDLGHRRPRAVSGMGTARGGTIQGPADARRESGGSPPGPPPSLAESAEAV